MISSKIWIGQKKKLLKIVTSKVLETIITYTFKLQESNMEIKNHSPALW